MNLKKQSLPVLLATGLTAVAVTLTLQGNDVQAHAGSGEQMQPQPTLSEQVNAALNVADSEIFSLDTQLTLGAPITAVVPIDGQNRTLELQPYDIRSDSYELLIQVEGGAIVPHEPGPVSTYRGTVAEIPGSRVAASVNDYGLEATVFMPGSSDRFVVEPVRSVVETAGASDHVVYYAADADCGGTCGADHLLGEHDDAPEDQGGAGGGGGVAGAECFWFTEIAFDADWEYFDLVGNNSVPFTENRITGIINTVSVQYENDVNISYLINGILVRTTSSDPYTSTSIGGLLDQFRSVWNSTNPFPRDVAELFTGRNLSGGVIGIANINAICNSNAYNVVENVGSASCRSDLSAHELGHNWSALHCSCPGNTMNSGLTCANSFTTTSQNSINAYRTTREFCLDNDCVAPNDACSDAIDISEGQIVFETNEVTDTDGPPDSACIGDTLVHHDLWYRYIAPCDGQVTVDMCGSAFDTKLAIYEGSCPLGANSAIACDDNGSCGNTSSVTFTAGENTPYYIRVGGATSGIFGNGIFDVQGPTCIPAPANNACGSAGALFEGVTPFNTVGATTDGPDEGATCDTGSGGQLDNDIWYRYVAGCDGEATVSLCDATFDTKIAVYAAFCPSSAGSVLACNDDACGTQSTVTFPVSAGTIYRVRVGGANGETGSGNLDVSCGPGGDDCTGNTNGDNVVDVLDLVNVILDWGSDGSGNGGDVNGDLIVDVLDLVDVILGWGDCP